MSDANHQKVADQAWKLLRSQISHPVRPWVSGDLDRKVTQQHVDLSEASVESGLVPAMAALASALAQPAVLTGWMERSRSGKGAAISGPLRLTVERFPGLPAVWRFDILTGDRVAADA